MLYYSNEARQSHIKNIDRLKNIINEIPGNILSCIDANHITTYLTDYQNEIIKESKENK